MDKSKLQYITGEGGQKTAVILPIDEFEELLEDLHDLALVAERRDEPSISNHELLKAFELSESRPTSDEPLMSRLRKIQISASPDFSTKR